MSGRVTVQFDQPNMRRMTEAMEWLHLLHCTGHEFVSNNCWFGYIPNEGFKATLDVSFADRSTAALFKLMFGGA